MQGGLARADEWAVDSAVDLRLRHTDNLDLRAEGSEIANTTLSLSPNARFSTRSEVREIVGSVGVTANEVSNSAATGTVDYRAALDGSWRPDERSQLALSVELLRDSTQQSELAATGIVLARLQRNSVTVGPSWQWALDERSVISVGYQGNAVSYEEAAGLADYTDQSLFLSARRLVSERLSVTATATRRWFRADPLTQPATVTPTTLLLATTTTATDTSGLTFSTQYQASERLQLSGEVGVQDWKVDRRERLSACISPLLPGLLFPVADCQAAGVPLVGADSAATSSVRSTTYRASGSYGFETGKLNVNLGRSATASGSGSLLQTDQIGAGYTRRWSDTLSFSIDGSALRSRTPDGRGSESRYFRFSPALNWQIDPQLSVNIGAAALRQRSAAQAPVARANEVFVTLSYRFLPITMSR